MTAADLRTILAEHLYRADELAADAGVNQRITDTAAYLLDVLAAPEHREALVGWQIETGVLQPADLWAVPADPGEEIARIIEMPAPGDEAERERRLGEAGLLREALARASHVYLEHEPRPQCAPALYEIGGERG